MIKRRKSMSKVISLFNTKHGVGKTTIAFNLHKFLRLPVYELEEDFFSYCNNLLDQKKYVYDFSKKIPPTGIYDLNSNDLALLKPILKISDYIVNTLKIVIIFVAEFHK